MHLFKYLHPKRTDVLRDANIRFSSPKALNDPFELKPHISSVVRPDDIPESVARALPEQIDVACKNMPSHLRAVVSEDTYRALLVELAPVVKSATVTLLRTIDPMVVANVEKAFEDILGILCLTENPASLLMWAHYADSHQGFVLEFDPDSPFFNQRGGPEDEFRYLRQVIYRDERPTVVLTELEDFSPFLTKGLDWSYEAEWRMLMPLSAASRTSGQGPTAIHLFAFPRSMVRRVIFGCRMAESKKAEIRQIINCSPEYENVQCAQAQIDARHYRLLTANE
jgi:hypothetical protein